VDQAVGAKMLEVLMPLGVMRGYSTRSAGGRNVGCQPATGTSMQWRASKAHMNAGNTML
jgi:hypothetical protein